MATMPPDDDNPFAPPRTVIGDRAARVDFEADDEAELIRRHHLSHESSIKSLGLILYLIGLVGILFAAFGVLAALGIVKGNAPPPGTSEEMMRIIMWAGAAFWAVVSSLGFALGFGMRRLQVWARWTLMVLSVLALLYFLVVGLVVLALLAGNNPAPVLIALLFAIAVQAAVFYLLVAPRSGMVFSAEYRLVIARTPQIVCRTSLVVKLAVGLLAGLVLLGLIGMIGSAFR